MTVTRPRNQKIEGPFAEMQSAPFLLLDCLAIAPAIEDAASMPHFPVPISRSAWCRFAIASGGTRQGISNVFDNPAVITHSESRRFEIEVCLVRWPCLHGNANHSSEKADLGDVIDMAYRDLLWRLSRYLWDTREKQDHRNEQ